MRCAWWGGCISMVCYGVEATVWRLCAIPDVHVDVNTSRLYSRYNPQIRFP